MYAVDRLLAVFTAILADARRSRSERDYEGQISPVQEQMQLFVRCSARLLLSMSVDCIENGRKSAYRKFPIRAMTLVLGYFVEKSDVDRGFFEGLLPYHILHSCAVDIALGKRKASDEIDMTVACAFAEVKLSFEKSLRM